MSLTFVDLSELLFVINFDSDTVLKHVLYVLAPLHRLPVFILRHDDLLEV